MMNVKLIKFSRLLLVFILVMSILPVTLSESSSLPSQPDEEKISEISSQIAELEAQIQNLSAQKSELEKQLLQLQGIVKPEDFNIQTYIWADDMFNYCAFEILSKASVPVSLDIAVRFFDDSGNLKGNENTSVSVIGPNEQTICIVTNSEKFSKVEYDITPDTFTLYHSALSYLSPKYTKTSDGIIVSMKNDGDVPADFVEGYVLFLSKGKVIAYDIEYFTDNNYQILPGKTIDVEFRTSKKYDDIKVFFAGRIGE